MNCWQLKSKFHEQLSHLYPKTEIDSFVDLLMEHILGLTRIDRALQPKLKLLKNQLASFEEALELLKKEVPVQYILGQTTFYNLPIQVDENVLIPRPETEELVKWVLDDLRQKSKLNVLDIGTGSGCIAIALAKNLHEATVCALDISEGALSTAKKNALHNQANIRFVQKDILRTKTLSESFDVIVSNPPYVRTAEKKDIQNNVLQHEPHKALFVDDENPLIFYQKISDLALKYLNPGGHLYFEINQSLKDEMLCMLTKKGFSKNESKRDLFGNHRMTRSQL